jgi:predicted ribosome quality control (RQC) complex YloA/Tae2 family protein
MPCDVYDSVDEAVRAFVRSYLAERAFVGRREPIRRKLTDELERLERGLMQMQEELSAESRADRFERWAHVLMAQPNAVPRGADEAILPDVFEAGSHVRIPLDPAFSALENAQRFYDRARRTRTAREHASDRAVGLAAQQESLGQALRELEAVGDLPSMREFERRHVELLNRLTQTGRSGDAPSRFRTFRVAGGFEVLVGRNAAQNERLTFEVAAKHDVWLHARGTPGSHVVLRLPGPNQEPPRAALEEAASIAAHFSKASGSGLVPVVVTRRKHVRRARNAAPGSVIVEREEVLIVPPRLPSEDASADA